MLVYTPTVFWSLKSVIKKVKKLAMVDLETGEVVNGIPMYVQAKVKWKEGFFMAIQEAFIQIAKDKDLNGRPTAILMYLFGKLGFENYICVQQREISESLKIHKADVSKSIKLLIEKRIILPGPKLGRTTSYRLNSEYGWKGKVKNLADERSKRDHLRLVS